VPGIARERAENYARLTELIEAGNVDSVLDRTFPLQEAAEAVRQLECGRIRGKVAIVPYAPWYQASPVARSGARPRTSRAAAT
jgi:hypothetical protein